MTFLLDLDLGADFFELLLHGVAFFLRDTSLHRLWRAFDQILRFLQPEAGKFTNDLNDLDFLVRRSRHKHDVERCLLRLQRLRPHHQQERRQRPERRQ